MATAPPVRKFRLNFAHDCPEHKCLWFSGWRLIDNCLGCTSKSWLTQHEEELMDTSLTPTQKHLWLGDGTASRQ